MSENIPEGYGEYWVYTHPETGECMSPADYKIVPPYDFGGKDE
jgi:hypothetical protein